MRPGATIFLAMDSAGERSVIPIPDGGPLPAAQTAEPLA